MTKFGIINSVTGQNLGIYDGSNEFEAYQDMCIDQGYSKDNPLPDTSWDKIPDTLEIIKVECCRPLYVHYDGQYKPQPVYVMLDQHGKISVDYDSNIDGTPADVFNGLTLRWRIESSATQNDIDDIIEHIKPYVDIIINNSEIDCKNCNWTRVLNETAYNAKEEIEVLLQNYSYDYYDSCDNAYCKYCHNT